MGGFNPLFIILQITFDFTTSRKKNQLMHFTSFAGPSCVGHDGTLTSKFYLGFCLNKNFVGKVLVTHCIEIDYTLVTRSTEVDSTVTHNTEFDSMLSLKVKKKSVNAIAHDLPDAVTHSTEIDYIFWSQHRLRLCAVVDCREFDSKVYQYTVMHSTEFVCRQMKRTPPTFQNLSEIKIKMENEVRA